MAERPGRRGAAVTRRCVSCCSEERKWRAGRCPACALEEELGRLRAEGEPSAVARLDPLLAQLAARDKPRSALSWLGRSPAAPTFRALLRGEIPIDHAALDEHDVGQATAYLRAWLVGHGVLEQRDERLARFERWANATLAGVAEHPDRAHLVAYARWRLRPDLARRFRTGNALATSHRWSYAKLLTAVHLTAWLHDRGRALGELRQPLLDEWIATAPSRALATRDFVDWANSAGLLPVLEVRRPAPQASATPIDQATRLRQARGLLESDTLELPTRVAGCLVLLYGQQVTRIATLRSDDVDLRGTGPPPSAWTRVDLGLKVGVGSDGAPAMAGAPSARPWSAGAWVRPGLGRRPAGRRVARTRLVRGCQVAADRVVEGLEVVEESPCAPGRGWRTCGGRAAPW